MRFKLFFKRKSVSEGNSPDVEDVSVANTPDAVFKVMKATMLIQKWYRRYKARLEARRQYTWNIFTTLEYASEQDQLRLSGFFNDVISSMEDDKSHLRSCLLQGTTVVSISDEDDHIRSVANVDSILVENSYKGHRLTWPLGRDQLAAVINSFKDKQILHAKFVIEILLAVRDQLKRLRNINHVSTGMYSDCTLCGDLHGQLEDLLMIFYKNGLPSSSNCYIFNGDLVDRGTRSVEVSIVIFICYLLYPNAVFFNRGNHEDHIVNCRYGFIKEVTTKYKSFATRILTLYKDIFSWLPLASIIDKRVLAMHGGCSDTLDLDIIERLDRHKYLSALKPSNIEEIENILSTAIYANSSPEILEWKQILDLLWSDPRPQRGCHPNTHRGGGTYWGPDVSENILLKYNFELIVRSHECKAEGYEYCHDDRVLTIFSASNYYSPGSNKGAFLKLAGTGVPPSLGLIQPKILQYVCQKRNKVQNMVTLRESVNLMERSALQNIQVKLLGNKSKLLEEFRKRDPYCTGVITLTAWVQCVESVVGLTLPWRQLARRVAKVTDDNKIRYSDIFTSSHNNNQASGGAFLVEEADDYAFSGGSSDNSEEVIETLYQNRESLETIFRLMDKDNSGKLSFDEFENGCRMLSKHVGNQINAETIHNMALSMDANRDGQIDFNEFLEGIRLVTKVGPPRTSTESSSGSTDDVNLAPQEQIFEETVASYQQQQQQQQLASGGHHHHHGGRHSTLSTRRSTSAIFDGLRKHATNKPN